MTLPSSFNYEQLLACGRGELFGDANARLPLPPMLMFDRITLVDPKGGSHGRGVLRAELDIRPDLWFFACHFEGDPVMPGCLGVDAMWQLAGFYLPWLGEPGRGRALGVGQVKFSGQVNPDAKLVTYEIDIRRVMRGKLALVILLSGAHGFFAGCVRRFAEDRNTRSQKFYRIVNEVPTLLMIGIVILVIVKPF